jgi:hypothetical protein
MFRAEVLWLANGPTLKMEARVVGEWAEQAKRLVTPDIIAVCERIGLSPVRKMPALRDGRLCVPMRVVADPGRRQKEEE